MSSQLEIDLVFCDAIELVAPGDPTPLVSNESFCVFFFFLSVSDGLETVQDFLWAVNVFSFLFSVCSLVLISHRSCMLCMTPVAWV